MPVSHKTKAAAPRETAAPSSVPRGGALRRHVRERAYCAICDFLLFSNFQNT
jgi:hypothetical protein